MRRWRLEICTALVWLSLLLVLSLLCGCYSPAVVRESDTSAQQEEIRRVKEKLGKVPESSENKIVPRDRAVIYQAGDALSVCATSLQTMDAKVNQCAGHLKDCGHQYDSISAELKKCKAETGFLASVSNFFSKVGLFFVGLGSGAVLAICGIIAMHITGSLGGMLARIPRP